MALEEFITTNLWLVYLVMVWEVAWTGIAMWKSAKNKHIVWFIVFLVLQILAIPEIIYIIIDSKKKGKKKPVAKKTTKKKKK